MNCVGSCPDNAPVLVMSALECMTCEQYNIDTPYWNKADKKCYSRCPDSAPVAVFDACTPCMNVSSSTPFYDRASGSCVAKCPQSSPVHDSDSICQTCQSGTFYDQQSNSCISDCEEYVENEVCVSKCTSGVYRTENGQKVCISECASKTFINGTMLECVEKCESFFVVDGEKTYCYGSCPSDRNFRDEGSYQCKTGCDSKPYVPKSDGNICVA